MFFSLIIACTLLSLFVSIIAMLFFSKPIRMMVTSILPQELADAWATFMKYMIVVIGVGGGVRVYNYEKYIDTGAKDHIPTPLTNERWALELYDTLLNTLSSIGWLVFWLFAVVMIAYVILKVRERRKSTPE